MTTKRAQDEKFMREAIKELRKVKGPKRFGAVIVKNGKVVARGHNTTYETNNPVTCSGINAIIAACKKFKSKKLEHCTLYETGESCLMCAGVIMKTGIRRCVIGFSRTDYAAMEGKKAKFWYKDLKKVLPKETEVLTGVLRKECMELMPNPKFSKN